MQRALLTFLIVLAFALSHASAQEQPAVNCATIEQCRILVIVTRGQLLSAQDAWAFWAHQADTLQKKLDMLQKDIAEEKAEKKEKKKNE